MENETTKTIIKKSEYEKYVEKGVNYQQYKEQMAEDLARNQDVAIKEYINLNQHRMQRVEKTYQASPELAEQVKHFNKKTYWIILTEHWCGDASQTLPVFNEIEKLSDGKITMKLVYRDRNPELMDAYLTNGTRSIPKLIQLDEHFNVSGTWGPRPAVAQKLVKELKSNPETAATYANQLHLWYAKDKQQALEKEIAQLMVRANLGCSDCLR
jgi:Thioredoxin